MCWIACADIDLYRGATSSSRAPYTHTGPAGTASTTMPSYAFTGYLLSNHHSAEDSGDTGGGDGSSSHHSTTSFPREVMVT